MLVRTNAQTVPLERALDRRRHPRPGAGRRRLPAAARGPPGACSDLRAGRLGRPGRRARAPPPADRPRGPAGQRGGPCHLAREYLAADPAGTAAGFDAWLTAALRHDAGGDTSDAVDVVTFHRAKGLEWPVVFVCGLERGLVPIGRAESSRGAGRGAPPALRRPHPGRAGAALHVGRAAHVRQPHVEPPAVAVARR